MKTSANRPASTPAPSLDGGQVARLLRPGFALAVLGLAQLLDVLDLTIVTTALPSMKVNLHMGSASSAWIIDAYALTYGSLLIFAGRLGDSLGRRRVFLAGATLFGVASLAGGLAANGLMLIIARAAQGAGGALSSACVLARSRRLARTAARRSPNASRIVAACHVCEHPDRPPPARTRPARTSS